MKKANLADLRARIGRTIRSSDSLGNDVLLALIKKEIPNAIQECEPLLVNSALIELIRQEFRRKRQVNDPIENLLFQEYGIKAKLSLNSKIIHSSQCTPSELREIAARKRSGKQPTRRQIDEADKIEKLANDLESKGVPLAEYFEEINH